MANKPLSNGANSSNQSQNNAHRKNKPRGSERPWGQSPKLL